MSGNQAMYRLEYSWEKYMTVLSVVLPAYNEEAMLLKTAKTLKEILSREEIAYELVFGMDPGERSRKRLRQIPMCGEFIFQGILERRQLFLQAWPMPQEIVRL